MATPDIQSAPRADLHPGEAAWQTPALLPDAGFAGDRRIPGSQWAMPIFFLSLVITGVGFLTVTFGMFVIENAVVWVAGIIIMDVGIVGWAVVSAYMMVAYIRVCFASREKSGGQANR